MTVTVSVIVISVHKPFTTYVTRKLIVPSMAVYMHFHVINCSKLFSTVGFGTNNLYLLSFTLKKYKFMSHNKKKTHIPVPGAS